MVMAGLGVDGWMGGEGRARRAIISKDTISR